MFDGKARVFREMYKYEKHDRSVTRFIRFCAYGLKLFVAIPPSSHHCCRARRSVLRVIVCHSLPIYLPTYLLLRLLLLLAYTHRSLLSRMEIDVSFAVDRFEYRRVECNTRLGVCWVHRMHRKYNSLAMVAKRGCRARQDVGNCGDRE